MHSKICQNANFGEFSHKHGQLYVLGEHKQTNKKKIKTGPKINSRQAPNVSENRR